MVSPNGALGHLCVNEVRQRWRHRLACRSEMSRNIDCRLAYARHLYRNKSPLSQLINQLTRCGPYAPRNSIGRNHRNTIGEWKRRNITQGSSSDSSRARSEEHTSEL